MLHAQCTVGIFGWWIFTIYDSPADCVMLAPRLKSRVTWSTICAAPTPLRLLEVDDARLPLLLSLLMDCASGRAMPLDPSTVCTHRSDLSGHSLRSFNCLIASWLEMRQHASLILVHGFCSQASFLTAYLPQCLAPDASVPCAAITQHMQAKIRIPQICHLASLSTA